MEWLIFSLFQELDFARNVQFGLNRKIEELSTQNTDLQQTIMQFRSFVNQLQVGQLLNRVRVSGREVEEVNNDGTYFSLLWPPRQY